MLSGCSLGIFSSFAALSLALLTFWGAVDGTASITGVSLESMVLYGMLVEKTFSLVVASEESMLVNAVLAAL